MLLTGDCFAFALDDKMLMDETYNVKAIILNRKSFSENDSRVTVYSLESGKLELTARGAKKIKSKSAGHLEPFNLVDIMVVRGQKHNYVGTAVSEKCYSGIKNNLDKLTPAGRTVRIIDQLIKPGVADQDIFQLLNDYLEALNSAKKDFELLPSFFILKLLEKLGHKPELSFCTCCVNKIHPGRNRFDLARGGLVCEKCADPKEGNLCISDDSIKLLRLSLKYNFKQLKKVKTSKRLSGETAKIIDLFFKYSFN